ncbi:tail fiber protein [Aliarcobacter cryaerophilus]|uniref:tail fiber protein n=1 Tax=Aliarcobacter cryaerophilus TaxID=28198 RepID=UPI0021B206F0|nr:tail fiber protein [Aliarcobacter cryaerophilus]MCT7467142.1 tail fiber protein [Aliarcobacter cryaerophilus]
MGMNTILMLIAGIVMSTMVASQVAPSIVEGVKVKKTQVQTINNQEVIFEAIKRYTTIKQVAPNNIEDLIDEKYIDTKVNDNGFGGKYTIDVNKALGVATITTTIVDPKAQEAFLNSFMGTSKPSYKVNEDGTWDTNKFETKYVLPNEVMHGNALLMTGIPIQATPPDSNINKYWYDTSSGKATLKLYDGTNWIKLDLGGSVSIGSIETFAGVAAKIPEGYLLCNGQEVSRTTYKDLFDVIGTTYGAGNGSTTFNVPDLRGKFIRGNGSTTINHGTYGNTTHTSAALGATQGDTIRNITGTFGYTVNSWGVNPSIYEGGGGTGAMYGSEFTNIYWGLSSLPQVVTGQNVYPKFYSFDTSRVVPTANENKPINMAMNYIIKY